MGKGLMLSAFAMVALAGCQMMSGEALRATAGLLPTTGNQTVGEVTFDKSGDKLRVTAHVSGLTPNQEHGIHIHEVGNCSSGDGMSAKGHFNPYGKPHGRGAERHAGDLPSLESDASGRARLSVDLDIITVNSGPASIIGRSVVVHAQPDDYRTQPTGNTGARLACGVIKVR